MKKAAFTIVAENYLPLALGASASFRAAEPACDFKVFVVGAGPGLAAAGAEPGIELVDAAALGIEGYGAMAFYYDVVEFCTAIKPACFERLLRAGYDMAVYIDPDTRTFAPFRAAWDGLGAHSALLVPHLLGPAAGGLLPEESFLNNGTYNLGFMALRAGPEAAALLGWWGARLRTACFLDYALGLATDQKWANLMPALFPGLGVLRDPGYDVAFWNAHERPLERRDGAWRAGGAELVLFHFSGYSPAEPERLTRGLPFRVDALPGLAELYAAYRDDLLSRGAGGPAPAYAHARYDDGRPVMALHRRIYFELVRGGDAPPEPFAAAGRFRRGLAKLGLVARGADRGGPDPRAGGGGMGGKRALALAAAYRASARLFGAARAASMAAAAGKAARLDSLSAALAASWRRKNGPV